MVAMHCQVIFLHGTPSGIAAGAMSRQSMSAIDAFIGIVAPAGGAIAIAVDSPTSPNNAKASSRRRRKRVTTASN
jgi:hypothetical protein